MGLASLRFVAFSLVCALFATGLFPAPSSAQTPDELNKKGLDLARGGNCTAAIKEFSRATYINPKFAEAWYNKGHCNADLGAYADAVRDYTRALELDPKDAVAYNNRGHSRYALGEYNRAVADYNRAI